MSFEMHVVEPVDVAGIDIDDDAEPVELLGRDGIDIDDVGPEVVGCVLVGGALDAAAVTVTDAFMSGCTAQ